MRLTSPLFLHRRVVVENFHRACLPGDMREQKGEHVQFQQTKFPFILSKNRKEEAKDI
jgi:hypothetical protein